MKIDPHLPAVSALSRSTSAPQRSPDCVQLTHSRPLPEVDRATALAACVSQPGVVGDAAFQAHFDHKQGWLGADGAYSFPLKDGRVFWLFSDTITGSIGVDGSLQPGWGMLHNSWGSQETAQSPMKPVADSLFPGQDEHSWYWVYGGEGGEDHGALVLLGSFTTSTGPEGFNFRQNGAALARLRLDGERPEVESITPVPHFCAGPPPTHWGAGLLRHQGNLYIYGTRDHGDHKELVVARTPQLDDFSAWTFWNGQQWSAQPEQAAPIGPSVANELSVSTHGEQFEVITQVGSEIWRHRSDNPTGPFQGQRVYQIPTPDSGVLTYNAKLHPHIKDDRGMLLTYNQNVYPVDQLLQRPDLYRPHCLRYKP
ncbi:hypothetical protein IV102_17560 [bacterium]|nr:hypothetical protein [bacterium]